MLTSFAVLVALVPLGAIWLVAVQVLDHRLEEDIVQQNLLFASTLADRIQAGIRASSSLLCVLARGMENNAAFGRDILQAAVDEDLLLYSVLLTDSEGRVLAAAPPESSFLPPEAEDAVAFALSVKGLTFSRPFTGPDGEPAMAAARGTEKGAVVGLFSLALVLESVAGKQGPEGGRIFLLDRHGNMLAASAGDRESEGIGPSTIQALAPSLENPGRLTAEVEGRRIQVSVSLVPLTGWRMAVISYEKQNMGLLHEVRIVFFAGAVGGLLLALILARWLSARLAAPVKNLAEQTRKVAQGDYAPLPVKKSFNELESLARDFSAMTEAVRKREQALTHSEERQRAILDGIRDAYYEVDKRGFATDFNDALCEILGVERNDLYGVRFTEFVRNEDKQIAYAVFSRVYRTGRPAMGIQLSITRADGSQRTVEVSASLVWKNDEKAGFRGIVRDVTTRRIMEAELSQTKQFLQNILESSMDAVVCTDLEGYVEYATPRIRDLLGITEGQMVGTKVENYYARGKEDAKNIMKGLATQTGFTNYEMQVKNANGDIRDVSLSVSLLKNDVGEPIGTMGIVRDVTWHKRLENQLFHAQKMEAIGTLAGGVAHDFNNLLMGVQGYTSLLLLDMEPDHPHYDKLKGIEQQVKSASDLTRQLLGLARGGKYQVRPENPNDIVEGALKVFGRTHKEIRIHKALAKSAWTVRVDRGQIEQVLLNLFVNAWQAMPGGGDITLETKNITLDAESAMAAGIPAGDYVMMRVTDTGVGMDEATLSKVFDPFFTTKDKSRGTGLGLASAYGIMKNHGGAITVESQVNQGTTFRLYIPAVRRAVSQGHKPPETVHKGSGTILLVDDEKTVLEVGRQMLESLGYKVLPAEGGAQAVELYREHKGLTDLVILDMVMPGMDGEETFDELKKIDPGVRVLVCSGYSLHGQASKLMKKGAAAFIQKPFALSALSRTLQKVLPPRAN
ncbi:MAG: PAS domain S-box protein [Deltaproteobacteria bacterium]|nr:PAS domain S-box protein [Deltaproteobacteria bacterium]